MFTYYIHDGPYAFRLKLTGGLTDAATTDLEQCRLTAFSTIGDRVFLVDIKGLTAVDEAGRQLLLRWRGFGAQFLAKSKQSRLVGESILGHPIPLEESRGETPLFGSLRFAFTSAVLLILCVPVAVWGGSSQSISPQWAALARYHAALEQPTGQAEGEPVAIEIEASLPKLAKRGRLQGIRRLVPPGKPEYEAIRMEGDRTVRQQVIARYLAAEAEVQSIPPSAVAVSQGNYRFRYVTSIGTGPNLTYVFQITPRKKRVGLIQGELWIDAATGFATHQAGRLVKRPSLFLRRVNVVKDTDLRDGRPYLRITRLDVDTLLIGRAELTIRERPSEPMAGRETAAAAGGAEQTSSITPDVD